MSNKINQRSWLKKKKINEASDTGMGGPQAGGTPDGAYEGPPLNQPGGPGDPMGQNPPPPPQQGGPDLSDPQQDITQDPQYPDMPEQGEDQDFYQWRKEYVKQSVKGDPNVLAEMIFKIRDKQLDPNPRKFVDDNLQICFLRQHKDILDPSQKIRKQLKDQFDRNLPGTNLVNYMTQILKESPLLNDIYIKLTGTNGGKQDYHRKFIASLLGAVQFGSGASNEDLILEQEDFSVKISTRFVARWGDVNLGKWFMREDDPEKYLKAPELSRLEGGSPEEKDVLRRRIIMQSIAEMFKYRAFIIDSVNEDGTIQHIGLDLGNCLQAAYTDGKLVVRNKDSDLREIFINDDGQVVKIPNTIIYYVKEGQEMDKNGKNKMEEIEFMVHRDGSLYLTAQADLLKEVTSVLQGVVYQEVPWQGNPTDLLRVSRCSPSVSEILLGQC